MAFACEQHSRMRGAKVHCLSLLFTGRSMERLAGRWLGRGAGTVVVGVLRPASCCGAGVECRDGPSTNEAVPQPRRGLRRLSTATRWQRERVSTTSLC